MQLAIVALLILAGFAAGVIFSGLVHAFVARKVSQVEAFAAGVAESARHEADTLRARVVELEQKVKRGLGV